MFLSILEALKYTWNRINSYTPVFIIFLLALAYLCVVENKHVKKYLVYPNIIILFVLLNPLLSWMLIDKMRYDTRVHRFFWVIPVVFCLAYACMKIFRQYKNAGFLLIFILFLWIIQGRGFYEEQHYKTENIYKIDDEVIEISQAIREISNAESSIIYINEIHPNYTLRQYDPSLCLIENAWDMDTAMSAINLKDMFENEEYPYVYTIYGYFYKHYLAEEERLYQAIQNTQIDYLILDYNEDILQDKGWILLEKITENYHIYKVLI